MLPTFAHHPISMARAAFAKGCRLASVASIVGVGLLAPVRAGAAGIAPGTPPTVTTTVRSFPSAGGTFVVRVAKLSPGDLCTFSDVEGLASYAATRHCGPRSLVHSGRVLPNATTLRRRWTVRVTVKAGPMTYRYAWVVSIAGRKTPLPGSKTGNWAGYALRMSPGAVSEVGATWVVPRLHCRVTPSGQEGVWLGVDGTGHTFDLFQAGIASSCADGMQADTAFYENLPAPAQDLFTVSPGDTIAASVFEVSPGTWEYTISDKTTGASSSATVSYAGPQASADWIVEEPYADGLVPLPLADFGAIEFSGLSVDTAPPALAPSSGIALVRSWSVLARCTPPANDAFDVEYQ